MTTDNVVQKITMWFSNCVIQTILLDFSMAALLAKFRIDYADVTVIPDVTKKAKDETKQEFKVYDKIFRNVII